MGRKPDPTAWREITCEVCGSKRTIRRCSALLTCSRSCSLRLQHANGTRVIGFDPKKSTYQFWCEKYGSTRADEMMSEYRQTMSVAISNADMTLQKEVSRKRRILHNVSLRGKSLEEIHGSDKALLIKSKISSALSGDKNPAYGKVYVNGGKSVKGRYKGLFFRSLLEYSFMKHLEASGISLYDDVDYECFTAKYTYEGRERTYRPDFYVKSCQIVYEVKPSYVLKNVPAIQTLKWNAMRELLEPLGIKFNVITDVDFPKVSFDVARQDPDVVWKEETFKYFKDQK